MGCILGRDNRQFLLEDDGTLWDMNKKVQFDRETFEPLVKEVTEVVETSPIQIAYVCDVCGFIAKNNVGLSAHKRFSHKGGT